MGAPTREEASTWLETVLKPLGRAVKKARDKAQTGDYSFRAHLSDFQLLVTTHAAVAPVHAMNVHELRREALELDELMVQYDRTLEALRGACMRAYVWTLAQPAVQQIAGPPGITDTAPYLAEHTVNGVSELPSHSPLRDVWAKHGPELLALRERPDAAAVFAQLRDAGAAFLTAATHLDASIEAKVTELTELAKPA